MMEIGSVKVHSSINTITLAKIIKINKIRTLEMNQKLITLQGEFIQEKKKMAESW